MLCNKGSHCNKKPVHRRETVPLLTATKEKLVQQQRLSAAKKKFLIKKNTYHCLLKKLTIITAEAKGIIKSYTEKRRVKKLA